MAAPSWRMERFGVGHDIRFPSLAPLVAWMLTVALTIGGVVALDGLTIGDEPPAETWTPRSLPAAATPELDPIAPVPKTALPRSPEPVAGVAFVRCTRLWGALPDGSDQHLVLDMQGISAPTFAPSGRTIAFLRDGRELWMTGADGSGTRMIGTIARAGDALASTRALNLTWSPNGKELGFAIVSAGHDLWSGGASLWILDLRSGEFERRGSGWPIPAWERGHLSFARWETEGPTLNARTAREDRLLSRGDAPLAAAFNNGGWSGSWSRGVAILRRTEDGIVLSYRGQPWHRSDRLTVEAPSGYVLSDRSRPVVAHDGAIVYAELIDPGGSADLGMFDVRDRSWSLIDYAWDIDLSPAPTVTGPPGAVRARRIVEDLMASAGRNGTRTGLILRDAGSDRPLRPFTSWIQHIPTNARRIERGWLVPVLAYGHTEDGFGYRLLNVEVSNERGRLVTHVTARTPMLRVRTIDEALGFLRSALPDVEIAVPAGLPPGTELARSAPVDAYRWMEGGTGTINLVTQASGEKSYGDLHFSFGEVSFNLGCGGEPDTEAEDLDGTSALSGRLGKTRQVLWPATKKTQDEATFTIYGTLPKDRLLEIARATEAAR